MKRVYGYLQLLVDMGLRGIVKTLYLNFKLLPFKDAIKVPLYCTRHIKFHSLRGQIYFDCPVRHGLIKIGFLATDMFVREANITLLDINGEIRLGGKGAFAPGVSISVTRGAILEIGENFFINAKVRIVCHQHIKIGDFSRIAWESQLFDTNFHFMVDLANGKYIPKTSSISIGDNVWIGNRANVSPGTIIPSSCIVASNSLCNKDYSNIPPDSIIGGIPARLLKSGYRRIFCYEEEGRITKEMECDPCT